MVVSVSELKTNPGYYIDLAQEQPIRISKNGKVVARLVPDKPSRNEAWQKLRSMPKFDFDYEALRVERILS